MSVLYETDEQNFEEDVLRASFTVPVLVDFWATWCGPCKVLIPTLERIAQKYAGRLTIVKVDVDRNLRLRNKYRLTGVPRMILFKNGKDVGSLGGAHGQARIEALIDPHVGALPTEEMLPTETQVQEHVIMPPQEESNPLDELIRPIGRRR